MQSHQHGDNDAQKPVQRVTGVSLHFGDCLDMLAQYGADTFDAVIADPPYGITANAWDTVIPFPPMWRELRRVCKRNAAIVLLSSQPFTSALVMSNMEEFRHEWVWKKDRGSNFANTVREPFKEHENIVVFSRGGWTYNPQMQERSAKGLSRVQYDFTRAFSSENYRDAPSLSRRSSGDLRVPSSVQTFKVDRSGLHSTRKPLELMSYLVRTYTNRGDLVLDFCMGSGTTGEACVSEDRGFVGIDNDPDAYATAERCISNAEIIYAGLPVRKRQGV